MSFALGGIIAKILILTDKILDGFVDTSATATVNVHGNVCAGYYTGSLVNCGQTLVWALQDAILAMAQLAGNLIPALGVQYT